MCKQELELLEKDFYVYSLMEKYDPDELYELEVQQLEQMYYEFEEEA